MFNIICTIFSVTFSLFLLIFLFSLLYAKKPVPAVISAFICIMSVVCLVFLSNVEINEEQFLFIKNTYNKYGECKNILPQNKIIDIVTFEDYERCIRVEIKKEEEKKKIEKYNELLNGEN